MKTWTLINKLENQIEATSRADLAEGFVENVFGGFDRGDLVEKLLREYSSFLPHGPEVTYRFAAALFRARRLDEARNMYRSLLPSNPARLMLAVLESSLGNVELASGLVEEYNAECRRANMPFMCTSLEKVAMRRSANY